MQLPAPPWRKNHAAVSGDAAARTPSVGTAHDRDDHGFAEAVDRLTRALQTGAFELPANGEPEA
jgi:hypothetical protein